jgi:hypothetical protein
LAAASGYEGRIWAWQTASEAANSNPLRNLRTPLSVIKKSIGLADASL